jgi:hypothetical protein
MRIEIETNNIYSEHKEYLFIPISFYIWPTIRVFWPEDREGDWLIVLAIFWFELYIWIRR